MDRDNAVISSNSNSFPIKINNLSTELEKWVNEAEKRIFSIAAGNRIAHIAPEIMKIGFAKVLYAANELGSDIEESKPFVFFAPDGTCTYNALRIKRCFTYGCLNHLEFNGLMGSQNSMPNGCGYSLYELKDFIDNETLLRELKSVKQEITEKQARELGKGNHFIAVYTVKDSISGEDTGKRYVLLHCSGHEIDKKPQYTPDWLENEDGYNKIDTPHGVVWLFESDARELYLQKYKEFEQENIQGRTKVMQDLFGNSTFELIADITHQGMTEDGTSHKIGIQIGKEDVPIAFNAEEGGLVLKAKQNLSKKFLQNWSQGKRVYELGYETQFRNLNISPHGGGYEFKYPIEQFTINLDKDGLNNFTVKIKKPLEPSLKITSTYFRPIREYMTYRRKLPVMKQVFFADLGTHKYDLIPFLQIHPKDSIPGGHY